MKWLFRLNIPDMPRFEQTQGIELFVKSLKLTNEIIDYFSTKDYWNILFYCEEKPTQLLEDLLKQQKWSHRVDFGSYICCRPIKAKILQQEGKMPERPEFPAIPYGTPQMQSIFFNQLEDGVIIKVPLNSSIIPEKLMKCFLWKEHLAFYEDGHAILWASPKANAENFKKALNAKLFDSEEMWKRDLTKDYTGNNSPIYFLEFPEFTKKMLELCSRLVKLNEFTGSKDYLNEWVRYYKMDRSSEIVQEFPELESIVSSAICGRDFSEEDVYFPIVYTAETIVMINEMAKRNLVVSGSYDPFGVRTRIKKISNWNLFWLDLLENSYLKSWVEKRIEAQISNGVKELNFPLELRFMHRFMEIDESKVRRLKKLIEGNCNETIETSNEEMRLLKTIENAKIEELPKVTNDLIDYIEHHKIMPYKNRKEIIEKFLTLFFVK